MNTKKINTFVIILNKKTMTENTTPTPTATTKKSVKAITVTDAYVKLKALPKNVFDKFESTDEIQQIINVAKEVIASKLDKEISDLKAKLKAKEEQLQKQNTNESI
jgi:hypothetical protein